MDTAGDGGVVDLTLSFFDFQGILSLIQLQILDFLFFILDCLLQF